MEELSLEYPHHLKIVDGKYFVVYDFDGKEHLFSLALYGKEIDGGIGVVNEDSDTLKMALAQGRIDKDGNFLRNAVEVNISQDSMVEGVENKGVDPQLSARLRIERILQEIGVYNAVACTLEISPKGQVIVSLFNREDGKNLGFVRGENVKDACRKLESRFKTL